MISLVSDDKHLFLYGDESYDELVNPLYRSDVKTFKFDFLSFSRA